MRGSGTRGGKAGVWPGVGQLVSAACWRTRAWQPDPPPGARTGVWEAAAAFAEGSYGPAGSAGPVDSGSAGAGPDGAGTVGRTWGGVRSQPRMMARSTRGNETATGTRMNGEPYCTVMM